MKRGLFEFVFVAVPKVLAGVCALAINFLLLRYFRPEEFGIYALCLATIIVADAVLGTAVDMAVMRLAPALRADDPLRCRAIQKAALCVKMAAVSAAWVLVSLLAAPIGRALFHQPGHSQVIYLSGVAITSLMLLRSAQVHAQIERQFGLYGVLEFLQMSLKFGGIGVLLAIHRVSTTTILLFFAVGPATAFLVWALGGGRPVLQSGLPDKPLVLELVRYVKWFLLTFSLAAFVARLDIFLVSTWSSIRETGIYSAGQTFALVPQLVGTYLAIVLSPRVMPYWQHGQLGGFFRRMQVILFAGAGLIYVFAVIALPRLGPVLLPARFAAAQPVILVLLPGALAGLITFPLTITVVMFLRPRFLLVMDCVALPIVLLLYRWSIPAYGAVGAAWVTSGACVIKAAIAQFVAWSSVRPAKQPQAAVTPEVCTALVLEEGKLS